MNVPKNSCDCHFHVFGPSSKYPYAPNRSYTPEDKSLEEYFTLLDNNGIQRAVIIHPSIYDLDNSISLDALKSAKDRMRGVVVINDSHDINELKQWHQLGVRGVRANLLFNSSVKFSHIRKIVELVKPLNWHLQLLINISDYDNLYEDFSNLGVDIVFDHMGHFDISKGIEQKSFQDMLRLQKEGIAWIKLSGAYRISKETSYPFSDVIPFAKEIIKTNPDRVVWASDWPHPGISVPTPKYSDTVNVLECYTQDEDIIQKIMVDNPTKLYDFN